MSSGGLGARAATKASLCGAAAGAVGPKLQPRPLRSLGPCWLRATAVSMSCRAALRQVVAPKTSGRRPPTLRLISFWQKFSVERHSKYRIYRLLDSHCSLRRAFSTLHLRLSDHLRQ